MAKTTPNDMITPLTTTTRKQRRFHMQAPNQPLMVDGFWYASIATLDLLPSEGVKKAQMVFGILGAGDQNAAILMQVKFPFEFGFRLGKDGEREYTNLTQFCMNLGLAKDEDFDAGRYEETIKNFDIEMALGLDVKGVPDRSTVNGGDAFDRLPWRTIVPA